MYARLAEKKLIGQSAAFLLVTTVNESGHGCGSTCLTEILNLALPMRPSIFLSDLNMR